MKHFKKYIKTLVFTIFGSLKNTIFFSLFIILAVSFVVVRMKGIELDYAVHLANKEYKEINIKNKELKAERASLLSVDRLRKVSSEYNLTAPTQNQVIVISD